MKRRVLTIMMIAALAVTALAGCGSKESGKTEGNLIECKRSGSFII